MSTAYCPNCKSITKMNSKGSATQPVRECRLYYKRKKTCERCKEVIDTIEVEESLVQEYDQMKKLIEEMNNKMKPHLESRLARAKRMIQREKR